MRVVWQLRAFSGSKEIRFSWIFDYRYDSDWRSKRGESLKELIGWQIFRAL